MNDGYGWNVITGNYGYHSGGTQITGQGAGSAYKPA